MIRYTLGDQLEMHARPCSDDAERRMQGVARHLINGGGGDDRYI